MLKQSEHLQKIQQNNSLNLQNNEIQEKNLYRIFYKAITDCETCWSSTFNVWYHLIILKLFNSICLTSMNTNNWMIKKLKKMQKGWKKIHLTLEEWRCIENFLEISLQFAELTKILEENKYFTVGYIYPDIANLKKRFVQMIIYIMKIMLTLKIITILLKNINLKNLKKKISYKLYKK